MLSVAGLLCWLAAIAWIILSVTALGAAKNSPLIFGAVAVATIAQIGSAGLTFILGAVLHWMAQILAIQWAAHEKANP